MGVRPHLKLIQDQMNPANFTDYRIDNVSKYVRKTDEAIDQIRSDIEQKKIFGSWQLDSENFKYARFIFFPMSCLSPIDLKKLSADGGLVYVYGSFDRCFPNFINEHPLFLDAYFLNQEDASRLGIEGPQWVDF